jgi:uncharacterized protein YjbJ (UPF0337 family)
MSMDRIEGVVRQGAGRVEDAVGGLVGDGAMQARGKLDEAVGSVQDAYGRATHTARGAARQVVDSASGARNALQDFVSEQPLLATAAALGIGLMLGLLLLGGGRAIYDRR